MVGLYKDPDGKNIVLKTTATTEEKESKPISQSDTEIKILQMRITELEKSLRQHVSVFLIKEKPNHFMYCGSNLGI